MSAESSPTRVQKAVLDEIMRVMHEHQDPGVTISEVDAEIDEINREQVKYRLQKLNEQGRVRKKKIGASAAIWFPEA